MLEITGLITPNRLPTSSPLKLLWLPNSGAFSTCFLSCVQLQTEVSILSNVYQIVYRGPLRPRCQFQIPNAPRGLAWEVEKVAEGRPRSSWCEDTPCLHRSFEHNASGSMNGKPLLFFFFLVGFQMRLHFFSVVVASNEIFVFSCYRG